MIEIATDNGPAQRLEEYVSHPVSEASQIYNHFLTFANL